MDNQEFKEVNRIALNDLERLVNELLPDGKRQGNEYLALNPKRHDRNLGSFKVNLTSGIWSDFASGDGGDIISLYAYINGCSQYKALKAIERLLKLDFEYSKTKATKPPKVSKAAKAKDDSQKLCSEIWRKSRPVKRTLAEKYLCSRGYQGKVPDSLRYCPELYHSPTKTSWPAMIAAVAKWPSKEVTGIHRTYLTPDGKTKAPVVPDKMMLGKLKGGSVRLSKLGKTLVLAEGIETALSVSFSTGLCVWSVLSSSVLSAVVLPPVEKISCLIIAADNDTAGLRAACKAADKWKSKGYLVKLAVPPKNTDFNDLLKP